MADIANKYAENISGKFYVDVQCIDCDLCRETAPANFTCIDDGAVLLATNYKTVEGKVALSLPERLRCRIRYFTDGLILGSQSFVESHFFNLKHKLGHQCRCPATLLTALGCLETLWVFHDLRVRPILSDLSLFVPR
jgi:hypothetical protein